MSRPLVSIVVTFRNVEPYLHDFVRSVFAQTVDDWELVMVDDGSTDQSLARLSEIRDERVHVFSDGEHKGTAERRNELTQRAKGTYLAVMDADDLMHPDRIKLQVADIRRSQADVTGGAIYTMDIAGELTGIMHSRPVDVDTKRVIKNGLLFHQTVMATREWLLEHPYDGEFVRAQDYELWCRAASDSSFSAIEDAVAFYRQPRNLDLAKYRMSCRANRRVASMHGRQFGRSFVASAHARSYAKEAAAVMLSAVGMTSLMVTVRHECITADARQRAADALYVISKTEVPGWQPA